MQLFCKPHIDGADHYIRRQGCKLEALKLSRRGALNLAPLSFFLLFYCLTVIQPLAATSLFDPKRGELDQAGLAADDQAGAIGRPSVNSSSAMLELRLDGILILGDDHRVLISGPEGEIYRFSWQGTIRLPMAFKGESADRLTGYRLYSLDARSVWLQLPAETGCEPNPEKGVVACEEGRAKLALSSLSDTPTPPLSATKSAKKNVTQQTAKKNPVQQRAGGKRTKREIDPALTSWLQKRRGQGKTGSPTRIGKDRLKKRDRESDLIRFEEAARRAIEDKPPGL